MLPLIFVVDLRLMKQYNLTNIYPKGFKEPPLFRFKSYLSYGMLPANIKSFIEYAHLSREYQYIRAISRLQQASQIKVLPLTDRLQEEDGSNFCH